jgi:hypothetical protein
MAQAKTQADKRRDMNLTDQFGRSWLAAIDRETFDPVGQVTPAGWADPINTPAQYLKIPRDAANNPQMGRVEVDMARWITDQTNATRDWKVRLWNIGRHEQKNAFDPKTAEQDEYLVHLAGPKPWPSPAVLKQARDGDQRLLGLEPLDRAARILLDLVELEDLEFVTGADLQAAKDAETDEERLSHKAPAPLNTANYKEFMAACLERKIPMAEAAKLWREFKGELAKTAKE